MEISHARTAKKLSLHMSPGLIRIGWIVVLFFHVFNAAYSCSLAYIYHYLKSPEMDYYVQLLQMMPQENYNVIICLYTGIGAVNFYSAVKMSLYSMYYRRLVFGKLTDLRTEDDTEDDNDQTSDWTATLHSLKQFVSGFARATSARGEWFDMILLLSEVSEIASQTVQAYSSSFLISSIWVNQLFSGLIFLNTMANTLVHYNLEERVGLRRLSSTAIDLILDFTWGFVLPGKIIFVYMLTFMKYHGSFPVEFNYSDTLQIRAILECNQFFMVTWLDAVTTTLPYLNMLSGLRSVKFLIQHDMTLVRVLSTPKLQPIGPTASLANAKSVVVNSSSPPPAVKAKGEANQIEVKQSTWGRRITACIVALMPLCGLFVLLTSIVASGIFFSEEGSCKPGCKLQMHPWFTYQYACSVMEISCYDRGITGREDEIRAILLSLEPKVLNSLIISHCSELVIPEEIRRFGKLMALELYNATVVDWRSTASLSLPYVPSLTTIHIVRSRFVGGIPDGLTSDLSPYVLDIEIAATDFGGPISEDLDEKWPDVSLLYIEHCGLQEFPKALARMALTDLSLADNNISSVPESLSKNSMYVVLDRNPIEEIPSGFKSMTEIFYLTVQYTNITTLPHWLQTAEESTLNFRARGTPYCSDLPLHSPEARFAWCSYDDYSNGVFPLAMRDEERAIK
ncbi:hypothetical protein P3T76_013991 [Phytophthora citrophthora]|uniref:Uncharacterized protein n=1 Tax=Phytophthora citrophthora TaxID=4793 RepID=A0AAD9G2Y1_9STRA|nr:hypothetical protein P3T76_013991 [Phytophthora citrophthora]